MGCERREARGVRSPMSGGEEQEQKNRQSQRLQIEASEVRCPMCGDEKQEQEAGSDPVSARERGALQADDSRETHPFYRNH